MALRIRPIPSPWRVRLVSRAFAGLLGAGLQVLAQAQITPVIELSGLPGVMPTPPARLTYWGFEVYDARLWTQAGFDPARPHTHHFALELHYLRRLEGAAIARRSLDEMRRVGRFTESQGQVWLARMRELFPDVREGDRITGVHRAGEGAEFWFNGQRRGAIADPQFAELFFGIWLHPNTSVPELRERLLKGLHR